MLIPQHQRVENEHEFHALEQAIRSREDLIYDPYVQRLLGIAGNTFNEKAYQFAVQGL